MNVTDDEFNSLPNETNQHHDPDVDLDSNLSPIRDKDEVFIPDYDKAIRPKIDELSTIRTTSGGSVANTLRGLTARCGVTCEIIGACGDNEQGRLFIENMSSNGVNLSRLRERKGSFTAQML